MKLKSTRNKYKLFGKRPGYLRETGEYSSSLSFISYNQETCDIQHNLTLKKAFSLLAPTKVNWLIYHGLPSGAELEQLGEKFGIHSLILEDIQNCGSLRPGIIDEKMLGITIKFPLFDQNGQEYTMIPIFILCKDNNIILFQTEKENLITPIIERLRSANSKIRQKTSDYLVYCLLDLVIDYYFIFLEKVGDGLEHLEEKILSTPQHDLLIELQNFKRISYSMRKNVWPIRDLVQSLRQAEYQFIKQENEKYYLDLYSHTLVIFDNSESYREMISGLLEIYLSSVSNKMNEVMKILTLIATIFIPLTFIAGIYGMNFEYMPELKWRMGYHFTLGVMTLIALTMLLMFKRKKWL
jgi:magnesium transporter